MAESNVFRVFNLFRQVALVRCLNGALWLCLQDSLLVDFDNWHANWRKIRNISMIVRFDRIFIEWNSIYFQVNASGVFELRLKSFVNEYGKDSLGKCCSGSTSKTGECSGVCKTRFRVCLKQYQVKIDTTTPCTYGDVVTPVLGENIVNLSPNVAIPGFTNPIRFPFDFTWPVSVF